MKKSTFFNQVKAALAILSLMLTSLTYAATFTATSSGKFSSTATWAGGVVPSTTVLLDQISIQSGVTVNLDNDLTINGTLASLDVEGTLTTANSSSLTLTAGTLSGTGTIVLNSVDVNTSTTFSFTGSLTATTLNSATGFQSSANIVVDKTLNLTAGTLSLVSGGSFGINNNGTINISGGLLNIGSGGSASLSGKYNVNYTKISSVAGAELGGSGLNNVTIDIPVTSMVTLTADMAVNGTLTLTSGILVLAGKNLTIIGNIAASGSGTVSSTLASDIAIATSSSTAGSLNFSPNFNTVKNFTVSVGNSGTAKIGTDLRITGILNFTGGTLNIGDNTLTINTGATITGTSSSSYIVTGADGYVEIGAAGGAGFVNFPIGTSTHYAPTNIRLNSGSASGLLKVGVASNVMSHGKSGYDLSVKQPLVDATWFVNSDISANLNLDLQVMWSAGMEVNGFNRSAVYVSHYTGGSWDMSTKNAATVEAGGMYSFQRNGLTSLSPFAVFEQNTSTAIEQPIVSTVRFEIFPNPASEIITFNTVDISNEVVNIDIVDVCGKIVASYRLTNTNNTISVNELPNGSYYIKLYNNTMNSTKSFIKI